MALKKKYVIYTILTDGDEKGKHLCYVRSRSKNGVLTPEFANNGYHYDTLSGAEKRCELLKENGFKAYVAPFYECK